MIEGLARIEGQEVALLHDAWSPARLKEQVDLEKQRRVVMVDYFRSCMLDGHHFYRLPGQEGRKPALSKEGALNICSLYKVVPVPDEPIEIWHQDGHYTVRYRTRILSLLTGQVVAVGDGMCSTRESKYAYRQASRTCPSCGEATMIKGREEYGGGWVCFKKKGGCGEKFPDGDQRIEGQAVGRIANDDLADVCNTVLKISEKRSLVNGALKLPLVSELFTQDLEEQIEDRLEAEMSTTKGKEEPMPNPQRAEAGASPAKPESAPKAADGAPKTATTGGAPQKAKSREQLLEDIKAQFVRLCGTDQQLAADICRHTFGSAVGAWKVVEQLPDGSLRNGLKKLQAMKKEEPPAVPPEDAAAATPSPEGLSASGEEDVPNHPPPDGAQAPASEPPSAGPTQGVEGDGICRSFQDGTGVRCVRDLGHTGGHYYTPPRPEWQATQQVTLPARPLVVGQHVSVSDARILELWAEMEGERAIFLELTKTCERDINGTLRITPLLWEKVVKGVRYMVSQREPEGVQA